jgi:pyruvate,water dikinase
VAARAQARQELARPQPPMQLGPDEPPPPLGMFPKPLARAIEIALYGTTSLESVPDKQPQHGTGVGREAYTGPARVGTRAEELFACLEPGDVLVVPFTTPAFNSLLGIAGAVVTEEGGPLCHAAVMARELGIPAVVGVAGVLSSVADGALVTVDPAAGRVSLALDTREC